MARSPKALHSVLQATLKELQAQQALFASLKAKFDKANEDAEPRVTKLNERIESIKEDGVHEDGELINEDIAEAMAWLDNYSIVLPAEEASNQSVSIEELDVVIDAYQERIDELETIIANLPEDCFVLVRDDDEDDDEQENRTVEIAESIIGRQSWNQNMQGDWSCRYQNAADARDAAKALRASGFAVDVRDGERGTVDEGAAYLTVLESSVAQ